MTPARVPGLCMQAQPGSQEAQFGCPAALRPIAWPAPVAPWPGVMGIITWCPLLTIPPDHGMPGSCAYISTSDRVQLYRAGKLPVSWLLWAALQQAGQGTTSGLARLGSPQTVHIVTLQEPSCRGQHPSSAGTCMRLPMLAGCLHSNRLSHASQASKLTQERALCLRCLVMQA